MKNIHKFLRVSNLRFLYLLIIPIFIVQLSPRAFGLSVEQQNLFNSGVYYFDVASYNCGDTTVLIGNDNMQKAFNYFVQKGLTPNQSAGIVGNLIQESHVSPVSVQASGPGHGIAQWSQPGRWDRLLTFANTQFVSPADPLTLATQLDFIWYELNGSYGKALVELKAATTIEDATTSFEINYEAAGIPLMEKRIIYAKQVLVLWGESSLQADSPASGLGNCVSAVNCALGAPSANTNLSQLRQNVICLARQELALWKPIYENNVSFSGTEYLKYTENRHEEWCANFASWIYNQSGYPIGSGSKWRINTVVGIQSIGQLDQNFHYHDANNYTPRPGDLAIHLNNGESHVNIVVDVVGNTVTMVGGNQANLKTGGGPDTSFVTQYTSAGFTGANISGYVSPD